MAPFGKSEEQGGGEAFADSQRCLKAGLSFHDTLAVLHRYLAAGMYFHTEFGLDDGNERERAALYLLCHCEDRQYLHEGGKDRIAGEVAGKPHEVGCKSIRLCEYSGFRLPCGAGCR